MTLPVILTLGPAFTTPSFALKVISPSTSVFPVKVNVCGDTTPSPLLVMTISAVRQSAKLSLLVATVKVSSNIEFVKNKFIPEEDIPVIYGNAKLNIENSKLITCGIDIFASSFFMLTRWEEYVNKSRDLHNRFPGNESLALKFNFLNRPIVNEYVVMLKNMMFTLDQNIKFKIHN